MAISLAFYKLFILLKIPSALDSIFIQQALVNSSCLQGIMGFENERFLFTGVDHRVSFCALFLGGYQIKSQEMQFSWCSWNLQQANEAMRQVILTQQDFLAINPNTLNCPVFRTAPDAELTKKIYHHVPVLENERTGVNLWGISFMRMFDMANDSGLFHNSPNQTTVPLYEAKMFHQFDHRFATYEEATQEQLNVGILPRSDDLQKTDPSYNITPLYWVDCSEVENRLDGKWNKKWLIAFRRIGRSTNERTAIFGLIPKVGFSDSAFLMLPSIDVPALAACFCGYLNSLTFDYVVRQKMGGTNLNFFIVKQLPVLPPDRYSQNDINYITPRVLELTYTAWDIKPFADDLWNPTPTKSIKIEGNSILTQASDQQQLNIDLNITNQKQLELTAPPEDHTNQNHLRQLILEQWQVNRAAFPDSTQSPDNSLDGIPLPPFIWHEDRRAQIRAELDAYYANLYGLTRDELRYILDPADIYGADFPSETFRVLKNNEMKKYGEYRTQRLVLEAWDKLGY
jgi:hypothetical protein